MTKCDSSDCIHNDKSGSCNTEPTIHKGRCVSLVTDMAYLKEKWVYRKDTQVRQNKPGYSPDKVKE